MSLPGHKFRLLQLLDGRDPTFQMSDYAIRDVSKYIALSYVWGSSEFSEKAIINGCRLPITHGLYNALSNIWSHIGKTECLLWIDAVCINQMNRSERNAQVHLMKAIFEQSAAVYGWLGLLTQDTKLAFGKLEEVGKLIWCVTIIARQKDGLDAIARKGRLQTSSLRFQGELGSKTARAGAAIAELCAREWWLRVWIVQEGTCLTETVLFCGENATSIRNFMGYERASRVLPSLRSSWDTAPLSHMEMRERRQTSSLSLLFVLDEFRFREATDPRDRVYAALGITTDPIVSHIKPDYNSPVEEVCRDLAKVWMRKAEPGHRLDILGCLDDVTSTTPKVWFPDWRKPLNAVPLYKHSKESITADRLYRAEGGALEEVLFIEIAQRSKAPGLMASRKYFVSQITSTISRPRNTGDPHAPLQDARSAFLHTVTADAKSRIGTYIVDGYHVQFDTRRRNHAIDWHFEDSEDTISSPSDVAMTGSLFGDMKRATHRRRFVWTNNGFMGLVPKDTKVGDRVCILFGGSVLYILSTHPDSDWLDVCIGQCYIHGLMDGEAFEAFGQGGMLR